MCPLLTPEKRYLLLAAIPEEYSTFLSSTKPWTRWATKPFRILIAKQPGKLLFFCPTGMGIRNIILHWENIINQTRPDLVISFGFCGELFSSDHRKVFLVTHCYPFPPNSYFKPIEQPVSEEVIEFCNQHQIALAKAITTPIFFPKKDLLKLLRTLITPRDMDHFKTYQTIVDMESALLANLAYRLSIPFLSLRATTDAHNEEIPFNVEELLNEQGFVSPKKAILMLSRNPGLLLDFLHFWHVSRSASTALASTLRELIRLSPKAFELSPPQVIFPG